MKLHPAVLPPHHQDRLTEPGRELVKAETNAYLDT